MRVGLVPALAAIALREPDATVGDAVDGADVDAVRADHLHVLGDLVRGHLVSPCGFTDCAGALGANLVKCLVGLVWHRWASSCCGSIGWKRLAAGVRVVVMRARSPPPGALRAACPGGGDRPTSREAARP